MRRSLPVLTGSLNSRHEQRRSSHFINYAGGEVKIADLTTDGMSSGSIAGAGTFNLGSKQLTVGSNNVSTTVSGLIEDHFPGGGDSAARWSRLAQAR